MTSPVASLPPGYRIFIRPPGLASISDPAPHQEAHRGVSVRNENTMAGVA